MPTIAAIDLVNQLAEGMSFKAGNRSGVSREGGGKSLYLSSEYEVAIQEPFEDAPVTVISLPSRTKVTISQDPREKYKWTTTVALFTLPDGGRLRVNGQHVARYRPESDSKVGGRRMMGAGPTRCYS